LNTIDVVWCSYSKLRPYFGRNSIVLSEE